MAGSTDDAFAFVLATARRTLSQVEGDPRVWSPVPGRGAALAAHVGQTLQLVVQQLDAAEVAYPAATRAAAKDALTRNVRLYTQLARALHLALPWLDPAQQSALDLGMAYFVDEMALALIGAGNETLAVPDSEYMYSTLSWPFRMPAEQALKVDIAQGARPIVLFFPLKEAPSALLHALFAHELGHASVDEHALVPDVVDPLRSDPEYRQALASASDYLEVNLKLDRPRAEMVAIVRLRQWIEELLCDALALQYLGPSYVYSFAAFVLASSWNDPQPQHPQPTLRVALLIDQLAAIGWKPVIENLRPNLWAWFEWVRGTASPPLTPETTFLRKICLKQAPMIRAAADTRLGAHTFPPDAYATVHEDLENLLRRRILPAEHNGEPVDRRSILLAGWMFALSCNPDGTARTDEPETLPKALDDVGFQRFISKALELSTVAETWRALR